MSKSSLIVVVLGLLVVIGAPAMSGAQVPAASDDDLASLERVARNDATQALARLELVLSRKALRAERFEEAAGKAQRVLQLLRQLPPEIDVSVYELQAEGILAKAGRAGVDVDRLRSEAAVDELPAPAAGPAPSATRPEAGDRYAYRPAQQLLDPAACQARDDQWQHYQAALERGYKDSERRALIEAQETRVIPPGVITYPDNWPEIVQKRAQYWGGLVARSPSWWDDQGREWYVAMYDIDDLTREPAYFPAPIGHPVWATQAALDRQALREHSYIFRGTAEDLAAGLPLLRYFGGVCDVDLRPRHSRAEQERIVKLIRAFTEQPAGGAMVMPLEP